MGRKIGAASFLEILAPEPVSYTHLDPVLAGAIAYNILTDRKDIIKPIGFHRESTALTDTDMKYLLLYLCLLYTSRCV